jgi:hypothetical protein
VKARLFNIFKYRGPEAYNRIVMKIRNIARQFRLEVMLIRLIKNSDDGIWMGRKMPISYLILLKNFRILKDKKEGDLKSFLSG